MLNTAKKALGVYLAMLVSAGLLTVFELVLFFSPETVQSFGLQSVSLVGSLNDLAVFFGLITIFGLLSLLMLPVTQAVRGVLWIVLLVSSFFLVVVNLTVLWWIVGAFALAFLIYSISTPYLSKEGFDIKKISFGSLFVLLLAVTFIAVPSTKKDSTPSITGYVSSVVDIGEFDVRPSWQTTISIADQALSENSLVFGTGPDTFYHMWARYMPSNINVSQFWLTDFHFGIGLVPTSFMTTGLLGAIAWVAFFVVFLWKGSQSLMELRETAHGDIVNYIRFTSFVTALYLWANAVIQVPSPVLILFAAILTGIFITSLNFGATTTTHFRLMFRENKRVGFLATLVLTVVILSSVAGLYGFTSRYTAEASFQKAARTISDAGVNVEDADLEKAYTYISKAISANNADVYYRFISNIDALRIQKLVAQGKPPEEIREDFEKYLSRAIGNALEATKRDKYDYQNWANLGSVYQSVVPIGVEGVTESAIAAYDEAINLRPKSPSMHYVKAVLERSRGDNAKARENVEKAITERNQYTDAIFLLAQIQIEGGDVQNAIKSVEAITLFDPTNAVAYFQLGLLHYAAENFVNAVQSFQKAVKLSPDYANAHYFLGLSNWRMGDKTSALQEFKLVLSTNPENTEVASIVKNLEAGKEPFEETPGAMGADLQNRVGLPIPGIEDGAKLDGTIENLAE
jgi:tetratricopeptide (TPR) repeat protein